MKIIAITIEIIILISFINDQIKAGNKGQWHVVFTVININILLQISYAILGTGP